MIKIIGLLDYDLMSGNLQIPNVEIMKLSVFYKEEEKRFCRLLSLQETDLSQYSKIFFFSEKGGCEIPDIYKKTKGVIYGGSAFTKEEYKPFENELIDFTIQNPYLYKSYLREKFIKEGNFKQINHFLDDTYHRFFAKDKKLIVPPMVKNKKLFVFDRITFEDKWKEVFSEILKRSPSSISCIHPVWINDIDSLLYLKREAKFSAENELLLDFSLDSGNLMSFFNKNKPYLLEGLYNCRSVYLPLGFQCKSKTQYYNNLACSLNILYAFWCIGIPIKFKKNKEISYSNSLNDFLLFIEKWSNVNTELKKKTSLISKIKKRKDLKAQYEDFLKYHPRKKNLFELTYNELEVRKFWKV